jgi:hypothetical protein
LKPDFDRTEFSEVHDDMIAGFDRKRSKTCAGRHDLAGSQHDSHSRHFIHEPRQSFTGIAEHVGATAFPLELAGNAGLNRVGNEIHRALMARIFAVDVLECPRCGGRMRILAAIDDPSVARKILDCLGLPSRPPPVAPARRNRHLEIAEL